MVTASTFGTGIVNGFALALVSLGFTLVFRATGVVNFANGSQMVFGGYIAWAVATNSDLPPWLAIVGAVIAGVASGLLIDQFALRPLRGASLVAQIIVLIAVTEVASGAFLSLFGPDAKSMTPYAGRAPLVPGLDWSGMDVVLMAVSIVLVVGLTLLLRGTPVGLRMRLVASNRLGATVVGVNPARVSTLAWCIGGGLAALSGALIFPTYLLSPDLGQQYTFDSFAAVVLGGFGSLPGAVVGGLLIGVVQAVVASTVGASYAAFVSLGVMLVILLARPAGLFGARG
jgi:branched-chain amino acid transport system permease protein